MRCLLCPSNATEVSGALRWGALWREVKEEGRARSSASEPSVSRPGGHERNRAPHRSALAQNVRNEGLRPTTATDRDRRLAVGIGQPARDCLAALKLITVGGQELQQGANDLHTFYASADVVCGWSKFNILCPEMYHAAPIRHCVSGGR